MSPCQSRWSCVTFSTVAASARSLHAVAAGSWTARAPRPAAASSASMRFAQRVEQRRADVAGHATVLPARSTSWPVSAVTVVLPLVPVMASTCGRVAASCLQLAPAPAANSSSSPQTGMPRSRAAGTTGASSRAAPGPGSQHTKSMPSSSAAVERAADELGARHVLAQRAGAAARRACRPRARARRSGRTSAPSRGRTRRDRDEGVFAFVISLITAASGWTGRPGTAAS